MNKDEELYEVTISKEEAALVKEAVEARLRQVGRWHEAEDGSRTRTPFQEKASEIIALMQDVLDQPEEAKEDGPKDAGYINGGEAEGKAANGG